MKILIHIAATAALAGGIAASAQAQKGKASELQPGVKKYQMPPPAPPQVLPAPAWFSADSTPTGVQLHWKAVPGANAYWIYRVANASAPDTGLIGNVSAGGITASQDGAFFDPHHIPAEYRIRAVDANNKRGNEARVTYR